MPEPVPTALDELSSLAATKARAAENLPRYLWSSLLAGAYVGLAVVLLISVSAPLFDDGSPMTKLVQGSVFGVALVLVVFAGAELFTGNAMVMIQGLRARTVSGLDLAAVWAASLVGNLIGSLGLAAVVHGGGTLSAGPPADLLTSMVGAKIAAAGPQLFWRAVLCNMLVCLALWMSQRAQGDGARIAVLWFALLAFIGSGFEHSVANMTAFGLAIGAGQADWADLARNLIWTVPGNVVGGGLIVGLGYSWLAGPRPAGSEAEGASDPAPRGADPVSEVGAAVSR